MEHVTTVYTIATPTNSEARIVPHRCGEEAVEERKGFAPLREGAGDVDSGWNFDDDGLGWVSRDAPCCSLLVPPALPIEKPSSIDVHFIGVVGTNQARIFAQHHSQVLFEKDITERDIRAGKIQVELPALCEGTVTFLLVMDSSVVTMPCCVVPSAVVEDIKELFAKMIDVTRGSTSLPEELRDDEQALTHFVWLESFQAFLTEVDLLFEQLREGQGPESVIMDVFTNVLRQSCFYGAWEFGAYMLNKASECGVRILSHAGQDQYITPTSLRASVRRHDDDCGNALPPSNTGDGGWSGDHDMDGILKEECEEYVHVPDRPPTPPI